MKRFKRERLPEAGMARWKKAAFLIVLALVAVRIAYIGVWHEVDKEYRTSCAYDLGAAEEIPCEGLTVTFTSDKEILNSIELVLSHVNEDKKGAITLALTKGEELLYRTNLSLANINNNEWKKVYVNAEIEQGAEYAITLDASEECTDIPTVFVTRDAAGEISGSYDAEGERLAGGMVAVNFGYLVEPGIYDCLSVISLWVLFVAVFVLALRYGERAVAVAKKICSHILVGGGYYAHCPAGHFGSVRLPYHHRTERDRVPAADEDFVLRNIALICFGI